MSFFDLAEAGSLGLKPRTVDVRVHLVNTAQATADAVEGAVLQFDTARVSSETTNSRPGASGSCWVNVVTPDVSALDYRLPSYRYGVALEAIAKGTEGKVRVNGYCRALMNTASGAIAAGHLCVPVTNVHYLEADETAAVNGAQFIFMLDEQAAAGDDGDDLRWGWLSGI